MRPQTPTELRPSAGFLRPLPLSRLAARWKRRTPGSGAGSPPPAPGWPAPSGSRSRREVRRARDCDLCRRRKQSLSPYFVDGAHDRASAAPHCVISEVAVDAVHRLVTDASRLKREWLEQSLAAGLTRRALRRDPRHRGGADLDRQLLPRARARRASAARSPSPGEPSRYRPASARQEEAWVPVVPEDNAGTPEADLWPAGPIGWVIRAMSLVPDEVRTLARSLRGPLPRDEGRAQSRRRRAGTSRGRRWSWSPGRVSALNGCFY